MAFRSRPIRHSHKFWASQPVVHKFSSCCVLVRISRFWSGWNWVLICCGVVWRGSERRQLEDISNIQQKGLDNNKEQYCSLHITKIWEVRAGETVTLCNYRGGDVLQLFIQVGLHQQLHWGVQWIEDTDKLPWLQSWLVYSTIQSLTARINPKSIYGLACFDWWLLICDNDKHYSCIRVRPVSI